MKYPVTTMPVKNFTLASRRLFNHTTPSKQDRRVKKKPRRNGASLPLLVPCVLARTRPPLANPAIHAAQHERAGRVKLRRKRGRLYRWPGYSEVSQRHRPSYTVSPAGQRLKRSHPAVGAAQAVGRHNKAPPEWGDQRG